MRALIMVLMFVAAGIMAADSTDYGSSGLEIIEVFRAETAEELEAALVDGYPMPWLEEILNDESIPEDDRYWLDCRVRAVIAQDLHLFFDEEGNPVRIEADWIAPGEDYWRENFMVNPVGEPFVYDSPDRPTNVLSEPGFLVNRFGQEIGQLAMTNTSIRLSRDASIGVTCSGILPLPVEAVRPVWKSSYVCLLYTDGSFKEIPIGYSENHNYAVSNDGNTIAATSYVSEDSPERSEGGGLLSIFDREGGLIHKYFMTNHPFESPAISANGRYVACQQYPFPIPAVYLIDIETGELLHQFGDDIMGHYLYFTPNERYLCIGGLQRPLVYDCETLQEIWTKYVSDDSDIRCYRSVDCENDASIIVMQLFYGPNSGFGVTIRSIDDHDTVLTDMIRSNIQTSPSGCFTFLQSYGPETHFNRSFSLPLIIYRLTVGE